MLGAMGGMQRRWAVVGSLLVLLVFGSGGCVGLHGRAPEGTFEERNRRREILRTARRLDSIDREECLDAARRLEESGAAAAPAAAFLADALLDGDPEIRRAAASALASIGPPAFEAAGVAIAEALRDPVPRVAIEAHVAWARAARRTGEAREGLDRFRGEEGDTIRLEALVAQARIGGFTGSYLPFLEAIDDSDPYRRELGYRGLRAVGAKAQGAVDKLAAYLSHPDEPSRRGASSVLASLGSPGLEPLRRGLRHDVGDVRASAAWGLGEMGPKAAAAVPDLLDRMEDPDPRVRNESARSLGRIDPERPEVVAALLAGLRSEAATREGSLEALSRGGRASAAAVAPLLDDPDPRLARCAADILLSVGPPARGIVASQGLPRTSERRVLRLRVLGGLSRDPAPWIERIAPFLEDPTEDARVEAVDAIGEFGPEGGAFAAGRLIPRLDDPSVRVARHAILALGRIGAPSAPAVDWLSRAAREGGDADRTAAVWALGEIGPAARRAVSTLVQALEDPYPPVRSEAIAALGKLGREAAPATDALVRTARSGPEGDRLDALVALGRVGNDPEGIVPFLLEVARSADREASVRAARSLLEIERATGGGGVSRELANHPDPRIRAWARRQP
jgi:HEAT repeat protein